MICFSYYYYYHFKNKFKKKKKKRGTKGIRKLLKVMQLIHHEASFQVHGCNSSHPLIEKATLPPFGNELKTFTERCILDMVAC